MDIPPQKTHAKHMYANFTSWEEPNRKEEIKSFKFILESHLPKKMKPFWYKWNILQVNFSQISSNSTCLGLGSPTGGSAVWWSYVVVCRS